VGTGVTEEVEFDGVDDLKRWDIDGDSNGPSNHGENIRAVYRDPGMFLPNYQHCLLERIGVSIP
jgi:hypothetical protein